MRNLHPKPNHMDAMDTLSLGKEILETCRSISAKIDALGKEIHTKQTSDDPSADTVLDYLDVCQILHISVRYLRILHKEKKLTGFKIGRRRFYLNSDVQRYLREVREKQNQ